MGLMVMLNTRVITAIIGIPVLLGALYLGGIYWSILFTVMGVIGLWEYYRMMNQKGFTPFYMSGFCLLLVIIFYDYINNCGQLILFILTFLMVMYSVIKYPKIILPDLALSLTGSIYLGYLLSYAIKIYNLPQSFSVILIAFLLSWAADTGGYFSGKIWGRHKLAPQLSPGKTVEGAIGAVVLSIIVAGCFSIFAMRSISLAYILLLGLIAGIMAQFGDLFMSSIKRYFVVKDSGWIIPGHGGILDRFDSFLLVAPIVYYFFIYFN